MPFMLLPLAFAASQPTTLAIDLEGLRNDKGVIQLCITRSRARFPDCKADPAAIKRTVPSRERHLEFAGLAPGDYAIALFHDENGNGKLDTVLGIPREGFGFSRNPRVRFGPPRYEQVSIELPPGFTRILIHLQYLL